MAQNQVSKADDEDLAGQINQLRDDVRAITRTLEGMAREKAENTRDQAASHIGAVADGAERHAEELGHMVRNAEAGLVHEVRTKPIQSMGIAAGLGLLLGYLSRPR